MADSDVIIQTLVLWIIVPAILLFVACQMFSDQLKSIYKWIFAYMMDRLMKKMEVKLGHKKQKLFADLTDFLKDRENGGSLLEIGAGSGANFQYYPGGCTVTCLEPNKHFKDYLEKNALKNTQFKYNGLIIGDARNMKDRVEHESVDAVVCTLVLCSIPDIDQVLKEVYRILKPGGKFYYVEHVAAPHKSWTRWFQKKITPIWRIISDGCELDKDTGYIIKMAGFQDVDQNVSNKNVGMRLLDYMLFGIATK